MSKKALNVVQEEIMVKTLCVMCAWRATCQKQFSMKAGQQCADYTKDLTIKDKSLEDEAAQEQKK
jgi:hypothetical protein